MMSNTVQALLSTVLAGACLVAQDSAPREAQLPESRPASEARYARLGDLPGVRGVVRFSPRLYRGAQPQDIQGMLELKKLGVTTILSVEEPDQPEIDAAKQAGIAVVNVPTEYNGIPADVIRTLVDQYRAIEGTVYAHCHHGKHRGGTAGAILRMTFEGVPQLEALQEMAELGCSKRYPGLYESVRKYRPDPAAAHRPLKPRPGIDGLIEVTPWVLRGTSALSAEALRSLDELGVRTIVTAGISPDATERARAAGVTVIALTIDSTNLAADQRDALVRALAEKRNERVFLHAADDLAKVAAMVAVFRVAMSGWTLDEAAREAKALVPGDPGAKLAAAIAAGAGFAGLKNP